MDENANCGCTPPQACCENESSDYAKARIIGEEIYNLLCDKGVTYAVADWALEQARSNIRNRAKL